MSKQKTISKELLRGFLTNSLKLSGSWVTIILFAFDVLWSSVIQAFIDRQKSKEEASIAVKALKESVKDKGNFLTYAKKKKEYRESKK